MPLLSSTLLNEIEQVPTYQIYGRVAGILGMLVEVAGLDRVLSIGARCNLVARGNRRVPAEVIGFARSVPWSCPSARSTVLAWAVRQSLPIQIR